MAEAPIDVHLLSILNRITNLIADEMQSWPSLDLTYPGIGNRDPDLVREGHVQSLLFYGLRTSGYFTIAEANYSKPNSYPRRIDLAIWLPDARLWLYLEIKPCPPSVGRQEVNADAEKLVDDRPTDPRDTLRGVLAYGFRDPVQGWDFFPNKYREIGVELLSKGFREIGIRQRTLQGTRFPYVQVGLWVTDQIVQPAPVPQVNALLAQVPIANPAAKAERPRE